ncbi:MAG TPA: hypothetical protein VHQ97_08485 [Solirubrobacterales bacterium]|nr:hypothetical protein [Solirubrobacterales bacterium]
MKRVFRPRIVLALACLAAAAVIVTPFAGAERSQVGNLIVSLNGGIHPLKLPRHEPAPVGVHLSGRVITADKTPVPRVNWIRLELAWRGVLHTKGLPVCPQKRIDGRLSGQAMRACGPALVGRGGLDAEIFVPYQEPFKIKAHLLVFNGKTKQGRPKVLVHAFTADPPVSFVIPFTVRREGPYRTILITTIRKSVGPWPHVANFHVFVSRKFNYDGHRVSYLSASCPIPKGFTAGFLSFARATYTFEGGKQMRTESVRSCRAR